MNNIEDKMYDLLIGMYKEMVISNQPEHLKIPQRQLFENVALIKKWTGIIEVMEKKNLSEKRIEHYIRLLDSCEKAYDRLIDMGCVDIDI